MVKVDEKSQWRKKLKRREYKILQSNALFISFFYLPHSPPQKRSQNQPREIRTTRTPERFRWCYILLPCPPSILKCVTFRTRQLFHPNFKKKTINENKRQLPTAMFQLEKENING
jgi:hypothetical protein